MLASVIIDNFNYARFLPEAIDSALGQTYRPLEVIVVDDGSTDDSRDVIAAYGDRITPVLQANGGQASTLNAGFAASRGDLVVFLDADDLLDPSAVASAAPYFSNPAVVKVHWPVRTVDSSGQPTDGLIPDRPLPEGDLREGLIERGPDAWTSAALHGNAFARAALDHVFPIPNEFGNHADIYPVTAASLYGITRQIRTPLGSYRIHGSNSYASQPADEKTRRNLTVYELRCVLLAQALDAMGMTPAISRWREDNEYYRWMRQIETVSRELRDVLPEGSCFILADQDEWGNHWGGSGLISGRRSLPFPEINGIYGGPPADDAAAIRELERLRAAGASAIVIGWPAFWWLDYYREFVSHLTRHYRRVLATDRVVVFALD